MFWIGEAPVDRVGHEVVPRFAGGDPEVHAVVVRVDALDAARGDAHDRALEGLVGGDGVRPAAQHEPGVVAQ